MIEPRAGTDRTGSVRITRDDVPVRDEPEVKTMAAYLGVTPLVIQPNDPANGVWRVTVTKADYDMLVAAGRHTRELPYADGVAAIEVVGP